MALMMSRPTHWMASITTTAMITTNRLSSQPTGMPLLRARAGLMLTAWSWLKHRSQTTATTAVCQMGLPKLEAAAWKKGAGSALIS